MSRVCQITGKRTVTGNNVSHAKNRTKRTYKPNLQTKRFSVNGKTVKVRLTPSGLRNIDKCGSFEIYLEHNPEINIG